MGLDTAFGCLSSQFTCGLLGSLQYHCVPILAISQHHGGSPNISPHVYLRRFRGSLFCRQGRPWTLARMPESDLIVGKLNFRGMEALDYCCRDTGRGVLVV